MASLVQRKDLELEELLVAEAVGLAFHRLDLVVGPLQGARRDEGVVVGREAVAVRIQGSRHLLDARRLGPPNPSVREHGGANASSNRARTPFDPSRSSAFEKHLAETENQVARLEKVFELLGEKPKKKPCKAMHGLIAEGEETIKEDAEPEVKDAALIAAAQRVEHY